MDLKNIKHIFLLFVILITLSCSFSFENKTKIPKKESNLEKTLPSDTLKTPKKLYPGIEKLTDIQSLDSTILIDLKYAGTDNFMKQQLYFEIDRVYLQKDVALRLIKVQKYLKSLRPDLTLLVYDGVRPLSVQKAMWKALDTIPVKERTKFVSNPANGSIHNYGAAIDLTLATLDGKALDMGAGYDDIRKIAYPSLEAQFLQSGQLSKAQVDNRKLLRKVMKSQAFTNISTEWWHFNACTRKEAKLKYKILE